MWWKSLNSEDSSQYIYISAWKWVSTKWNLHLDSQVRQCFQLYQSGKHHGTPRVFEWFGIHSFLGFCIYPYIAQGLDGMPWKLQNKWFFEKSPFWRVVFWFHEKKVRLKETTNFREIDWRCDENRWNMHTIIQIFSIFHSKTQKTWWLSKN